MQSNEVRIPKNPDFDLSPTAPPCQYFKSSFARSLSLTTSGTKSLDIDINFGLSPFDLMVDQVNDDVSVVNNNKKYKMNNESPRSLAMSCGSMGALKAARSLLFTQETSSDNVRNNNEHKLDDHHKNASNLWEEKQQMLQIQQQQAPEESQVVKIFLVVYFLLITNLLVHDVCV